MDAPGSGERFPLDLSAGELSIEAHNSAVIMLGKLGSSEFYPLPHVAVIMTPDGRVGVSRAGLVNVLRLMSPEEIAWMPVPDGWGQLPERTEREQAEPEIAEFLDGRLVMDYAGGEIRVDGLPIDIQLMPYRLAEKLTKNADKVVTFGQLGQCWEGDWPVSRNTLRAHMSYLRSAVGQDVARHFVVVRGQGYKFRKTLPEA